MVTGPPSKGAMLAPRRARAMQPPVVVPAKGPPLTVEVVTRPEGAKVTLTGMLPRASPGLRQDAAPRPDADIATAAAGRLMPTGPGSEAVGVLGIAT